MWGLQQITDLVPAQAETLLSQAAASARSAADAAASSQFPQPRLPTPSPMPRPNVLRPTEQRRGPQGVDSSHDSRQQSMQSVQNTAGDLYASSERGMVRTAGHARINRRQQTALRSGLLRLSPPVRQTQYGSAAAVLEPPKTDPSSSSSPPYPSASSAQSSPRDHQAESPPQPATSQVSTSRQQLSHASLAHTDTDSESISSSRPQTSSSQGGAASHRPHSQDPGSGATGPHGSQGRAVGSAEGADAGRPNDPDQGRQGVIRGRAPRRALAAAKAERQNSGGKAGPSGRVTPDLSSLSSDQQRVSHPPPMCSDSSARSGCQSLGHFSSSSSCIVSLTWS